MGIASTAERVTKVGVVDTASIFFEAMLPPILKGPIIRRPSMVALADRWRLDHRSVRRLQHIRAKYGEGPLLLRLPRKQAIILSPQHARRVLDQSPEPFATSTLEKRHALEQFQPKGVLISHGKERAERREFNEAVLETRCPMHSRAPSFAEMTIREADTLLAQVRERNGLDWEMFRAAWFRCFRQICFGLAARDDEEITDLNTKLRSAANLSYLIPKRKGLLEKFQGRLREYLQNPQPGTLAEAIVRYPAHESMHPEDQLGHWLFGFDGGTFANYRAFALLAAYPKHQQRARDEFRQTNSENAPLPFLRATVMESVRLWPTTPLILRQTTRDTQWDNGIIPSGTSIVIHVPFFHRDNERLSYADKFEPDIWINGTDSADLINIPFSGGPAVCPGQNLTLFTGSIFLGAMLRERQVHLEDSATLDPTKPLPATLNNFDMRFSFT